MDRSREKYSKWKGNTCKCIERAKAVTTKKELLIVYFIRTKNIYIAYVGHQWPPPNKKAKHHQNRGHMYAVSWQLHLPTPPATIRNSLCFSGGIVSVELLRYRIWSSSTLQDNAKLSKWAVSIYILTSHLVCIFTNS